MLITYRTVLSVESFLPTVIVQLSNGTLKDPAALAYMLRTLAKEDSHIREDPQVRTSTRARFVGFARGAERRSRRYCRCVSSFEELVMNGHVQVLKAVELLQKSDAAGARELATAFGGGTQAMPEVLSLQAARSIMRLPGLRDHDNDPQVYRDICIVPTPSELQCREQVSRDLVVCESVG